MDSQAYNGLFLFVKGNSEFGLGDNVYLGLCNSLLLGVTLFCFVASVIHERDLIFPTESNIDSLLHRICEDIWWKEYSYVKRKVC